MKHIILATVLFMLSCQNNSSKEIIGVEKLENHNKVNYTVEKYFDDTTSVHFVLSGIEYYVNYYENKPQYIRIGKFEKKDSTVLSYERDNRGVFIGLSDSLKVLLLGYKYLYGNEVFKCHLDSAEKMDYLEIKNAYYTDTPHIINLKK